MKTSHPPPPPFPFQRINATLLQTGYISNTTKSQISPTRSISTSFKRLLETTQWVFDAMQPGSLLPGHSGWKSTLRVRILHSKVRTRILSKVNQQLLTRSDNPFMKPVYSIEKHGVPINQEDSVATALVFFYSYIHHFKMRGIHLSSNELKDVLATWRYVSFLMGIEDECNPAVSPEIARGWYESIVIHLVHPDEMSKVMVKNILSSIPVSYEFVVAQFRKTVGDNHADALGLASYSSLSAWTKWKAWVWDWYCVVSVSSFEWPVLVWFKDLRLQLLRRMLVNSTVAILGKRTQFELKHFPIGGGGDARRPDLVNSTHLSTQPYEINVVLPPSAPNRHIYDAHMKSKQNVGGIQPFYDNFIWTLAHA